MSTCFFKHKVTSANNDDITYKCIEIWFSPNNIKPNNAVNNIEAYVKIEMSFAGAKLYANVIPICPTAADNPAPNKYIICNFVIGSYVAIENGIRTMTENNEK